MTIEKKISNEKPSKKKRKLSLCKAPQAPKRFRSSFILFFSHVKVQIKAELGEKATGPDISKRASNMWRFLSPEDRQYWNNQATKERIQYAAEKNAYTGPWQVPYKRAKKDPTAPRRNPSAFLLFARDERKKLRKLNPTMKVTDISRLLGKLWRDMPIETKRSYIEKEAEERNKYMRDVTEWRRQQEKKRLVLENRSSDGDKERSRISAGVVVAGRNSNESDNTDWHSLQLASSNENNHDNHSHPFHRMVYSDTSQYQYMHPQYPPQEQYVMRHEQYTYAPRSDQDQWLSHAYLQSSNQSLCFNSCPSQKIEWQKNSTDSQNRKRNHSHNNQQTQLHEFEPSIGQEILDALSQHDETIEKQNQSEKQKEKGASYALRSR